MSIPRCCFPLHIPAPCRGAISAAPFRFASGSEIALGIARRRAGVSSSSGVAQNAPAKIPLRRRILHPTPRAQEANFAQQSCSRSRQHAHPVASAAAREIYPRRFLFAPCTHFPHLLLAASVSIPTTIGRRFRHREHKILWFVYEFFLTSFPQPSILRFQARGRISWPQLFCCPQPVVEPDRVNRKSRGALPHLTPRLGFLARLSWAFVSFFSARTALWAAPRFSCFPQSILTCTATVHITSPTGRRLGVE